MRGSLDREDLHGKYLACDRSGATVTRVIMLPGEAGDGPVTRLLTVSDSTLMRLGGRPVDSKGAPGKRTQYPWRWGASVWRTGFTDVRLLIALGGCV